ncbi:MAG: FIST N-terminal domain-containing protein [Dehalococcoidia bacterium]
MAFSGSGTGNDWRMALEQALAGAPRDGNDLVFFFASQDFASDYLPMAATLVDQLAPRVLIGCSGQGVIATGVEIEEQPGLSVMALSLPGADLHRARLLGKDLDALHTPEEWHRRLGRAPSEVNAWVVLSDPYTIDTDALVEGLSQAYPGCPVVGGMASGNPRWRGTHLFVDGQVYPEGAVLLAVGGPWTVRTVVSQGAEPIGETWTITDADRNLLKGLGGRAPLEVLMETMKRLSPEMQQRASRNLLIGLAMDEYKDEFGRGDFLIRNLMGADKTTGIIAIGALPRVGQTLQFQVRDAHAADAELSAMLEQAAEELGPVAPAGALLCSCNGRGRGLFREPHHDATAVDRQFAGLPVAGFFCNGEIGPVAGKTFVHGFTASIAFFVPV